MSTYKLTYFDFSGSRGEECRLALFLAGVDFEDHRIARADWVSLKPTTPYGSIPMLEREGYPPLAQSNAILGYVGRRYGLHPDDAWEAARHEGVMAFVEELRIAMGPSGRIEDPVARQRAREEFASGFMQTWATRLSQQIRGPFVGGERLCVADLKVAIIAQSFATGALDHIPKDVFAKYQKLTALKQAVDEHPKVVEWRARH